jgi:predicted enzyme related to lactoylglutathione lyase
VPLPCPRAHDAFFTSFLPRLPEGSLSHRASSDPTTLEEKAMSAANGRFVWFDLLTNDVEHAKPFYGGVAGWTAQKWSGGDYEIWSAGSAPIGGAMALSPEACQSGALPHWMGYVATDDVDATARRAQQLGGAVRVPGKDIPEVGRFAVLADPQGASFAIYRSLKATPAPDTRALGHVGWAELITTDWKSAWKFYAELFGWRPTQSMDMGPELGEYFMFGADPEQAFGGMSNAANLIKARPSWLYYVNVKSADETAKRVASTGGEVVNGPMDVPGGGRIAQFLDPQGAMFAVYAQVSLPQRTG